MSRRPTLDTPGDAETAFYSAFERGDLDVMAIVWAHSEAVVCIHPHAPQLTGYDEVMGSWEEILRNTTGFRISVQTLHDYTDNEVSVRFVNETLVDEHGDSRPVTILATNAYHKTESGWHMVLHHASPTPQPSGEPEEEGGPERPGARITLH